ncbi:MAG: hypothetical protein EBS20_02825 [Actinobacteria bacterium]|nr:hypothetical protein [Actinomycetota bacterium]
MMLADSDRSRRTTVDGVTDAIVLVTDGSTPARNFAERITANGRTGLYVVHADERTTVMSSQERLAYDSDEPVLDPIARLDGDALRVASTLAFAISPTPFGLPSGVKGWIDRTLAPGLAFQLDERTQRMRPGLVHLDRLVGIDVGDSSGDSRGARRIIGRAVRVACRPTIRVRWFGPRRLGAAHDGLCRW